LDLLVFQSFSDVTQNITSATCKGVGSGLRLSFRHNETSCCAKGAVNGLQTTLQGKAGRLITVVDDWEQFHTLLNPAKPCHSLIRALQGHEKAVWKSRPGYLWLFCCGVWIVHECSYKVSQLKGFQFLCLHGRFSQTQSQFTKPPT